MLDYIASAPSKKPFARKPNFLPIPIATSLLGLLPRLAPTPVPLIMLNMCHLLRVDLTPLEQERLGRHDTRLPRRRADVFRPERIREHGLHLLERFAGRLREGEEDMDKHGEIEDAEDEVDFPLDVHESWGDEV